jgi:hypothetical protein
MIYLSLYFFGSPIVDSQFEERPLPYEMQQFYKINIEFVTHLDVSEVLNILLDNLLPHRVNEPGSQNLLRLSDEVLILTDNLTKTAVLEKFPIPLLVEVH